MLSDAEVEARYYAAIATGLNAPYGARCFLTSYHRPRLDADAGGLNAPYGARCFLTEIKSELDKRVFSQVLMHLMALGAF